ncbi:polyprenyl synthetase family protein [Solicola gregarius]|uniref:Polyprenyl synthetase family protein n=1 Tax=Solicola gregarius TaxID=2908642 RepID=A0AA46THQ5_9ACTN|nr:polyprenyl synthetase family protein [Solicola gregarius]UYM05373.1 polyprenyl synthetase family protein [Solicola gregarius]
MSTQDVTADLATAVQSELDGFVDRQRGRLADLGPELVPFLDAAQAFVTGGKRLRPAFCYCGWRAAGGDPDERGVVRAASSLEWLQASALVHDDVMDGSDVRRGRPAVHRAFESRHRNANWVGDAAQFGVGSAILLGDLMLSWCDEMFRSSDLDRERLVRAAYVLDLCKSEVVGGQFLDLVGQSTGVNSIEQAMRIVRYKAAKYTVERPLHVGAALAGADDELIESLSRVGVPLGEAFQLRDDVLGVFGDPEVTGKPAGDDLREGKRTVLLARAFENANGEQTRALSEGVGRPDLDPVEVDLLRDIIASTGALAAVEDQIATLEARVDAALTTAPIVDADAREAIAQLAKRATHRQS